MARIRQVTPAVVGWAANTEDGTKSSHMHGNNIKPRLGKGRSGRGQRQEEPMKRQPMKGILLAAAIGLGVAYVTPADAQYYRSAPGYRGPVATAPAYYGERRHYRRHRHWAERRAYMRQQRWAQHHGYRHYGYR